jgi:hypothetical protein
MSGILQAFAYGRAFTSAPVNTVAPVVSGTATFGQTLSSTTGTWTGIPTPTFTYQWQRVTTNISGATSSTYVLVAADVGSTIRCVVTATNSTAAVSANSNSTASVAATVPGAPTIGTATATGTSTATVAYTAPASNGGATITLYTATSSPGGLTGTLATAGSGTITVSGLSPSTAYTFTVRATNSVGQGAASAASNSITTNAANLFSSIYPLRVSSNIGVNNSGTVYQWMASNAQRFTVSTFSGNSLLNVKTTSGVSIDSGNTIFDASANAYISSGTSLWKMNSAFTITDQLQWTTAQLSASSAGNGIALDSSGRLWSAGTWRESAGKFTIPGPAIIAINGTDWANRRWWSGPAGEPAPRHYGSIACVGSNLIIYGRTTIGMTPYALNVWIATSPGASTASIENSNTASNGVQTTNNQSFDNTNLNGGYNSADNSHWVTANRYSSSTDVRVGATFVKFNSAGAYSGVMGNFGTAASGGPFAGNMKFDSSGNMYWMLRTDGQANNNVMWFAKYNSSGTIQWQRKFTVTSTSAIKNIRPGFVISGTNLYFGFTIGAGSGQDTDMGCTISYPLDGAKTGTFSITNTRDATLTIVASTESTTTQTLTTTANNWQITHQGTPSSSSTSSTGTLSNASYTANVTTY